MRFRLTVEYDGSLLVGWQAQENGPSVQSALETAIYRFTGEKVPVIGAGRTDAGVHASGQVAHFDLIQPWDPARVLKAINFHLRPLPIAVIACSVAGADFHARFSAIRRHYRYGILNRIAPPALERGRVWHVSTPLDAAAMHGAAQYLVGHHDFSSFRAQHCQAASPVKTLDRLDVIRNGAEIVIETEARSFLHHQVRVMVGSLKLVGEGKWSTERIREALAARDRAAAGPTAPAGGLCLIGVDYEDQAG